MTAEYTWPDEASLKVEPAREVIANLVYECSICSVKCNCAATFKLHIDGAKHKKNIAEAGKPEDESVQEKIKVLDELEKPHRGLRKEDKTEKFKEMLAKKKAEKEGKTKEELKAEEKEKKELKRKRIEAGEIPKSKKANQKVKVDYTCAVCDVKLDGMAPFESHMHGKAHMKKVNDYAGGCWLCAMPGNQDDSHFTSEVHKSALCKLAQCGVDPSSVGESGWFQMKGAAGSYGGGGDYSVGYDAYYYGGYDAYSYGKGGDGKGGGKKGPQAVKTSGLRASAEAGVLKEMKPVGMLV